MLPTSGCCVLYTLQYAALHMYTCRSVLEKLVSMGVDITYIVYSIYVGSCLQQQSGLSVKAMLGSVMECIPILLQTEENRLSKDQRVFGNLLCLLQMIYEQIVH